MQFSPHQKVPFNGIPHTPRPTTTTVQSPPSHNSINHHLPEEPINAAIRQLHERLSRQNKNQNTNSINHIPNNQPQSPFQQRTQFQHSQQFHPTQQTPTSNFVNHFNQPAHQFSSQNQGTHQNQPQQQPQSPQHGFQSSSLVGPHQAGAVQITNQFGHVINPNRFPGPLADSVPAAVNGPVFPVGDTAAVDKAKKDLALTHMQILAHHATLPQTPAPKTEKQRA